MTLNRKHLDYVIMLEVIRNSNTFIQMVIQHVPELWHIHFVCFSVFLWKNLKKQNNGIVSLISNFSFHNNSVASIAYLVMLSDLWFPYDKINDDSKLARNTYGKHHYSSMTICIIGMFSFSTMCRNARVFDVLFIEGVSLRKMFHSQEIFFPLCRLAKCFLASYLQQFHSARKYLGGNCGKFAQFFSRFKNLRIIFLSCESFPFSGKIETWNRRMWIENYHDSVICYLNKWTQEHRMHR